MRSSPVTIRDYNNIVVVTAYLFACFPCYLNSPVYLPPSLFAHYFSSRFPPPRTPTSIAYHIEFISFHNTAQIRRPCFFRLYIRIIIFYCLYHISLSPSLALFLSFLLLRAGLPARQGPIIMVFISLTSAALSRRRRRRRRYREMVP